MKKRMPIPALSLIVLLAFLVCPPHAFSQKSSLVEGIEQYKQENFVEAVKSLKKARQEDPNSSAAAFFLGLAYKQLLDFKEALANLRDAVTLKPRIKEALVELIEVLYELYEEGSFEEARKWIEVAEKEDIYPAKTAFLKGLILQKAGENLKAIASFEKAKRFDKTLTQSADIQIAMCYIQEKNLKKAGERFKAAIQFDPQSDLASFARQYQDMVEKQLALERPLRLTLGLFGYYDTNVVLKPTESTLAPDITDEASRGMNTTLRLDYVPRLEAPWLFNAQYTCYGNFHDRFSTSHDVVSNGIFLSPGYNFGESALNLAARYNHSLVRGPSYKKYMDSINVGPLYRRLLNEKNILEFFAGYNRKEYFRPPLVPEEDRDSTGLNAYVSWIWLFKEGAFFNLKYEFTDEDTDGINWENQGHGFSLNVTLPLRDKVKLQLGGQMFLQDFRFTHTGFGIKREDSNYTGQVGLSWDIFKNTTAVLQFTKSRADSNIAIYDYETKLYSLGLEYRY